MNHIRILLIDDHPVGRDCRVCWRASQISNLISWGEGPHFGGNGCPRKRDSDAGLIRSVGIYQKNNLPNRSF